MNENEIHKRMNATVDILTWLKQQIAQQVEHQVEQRLAREREYWRCTVTDLILAEREQLVAALSQKLFGEEALGAVMKIVKEGLARVVERVDAKLAEVDRQLASARPRDER